MMQHAFATFTVKSTSEPARVLHGIASSPSVDHLGDSIEPEGAEFTLPLPLLRSHNSNEPIGQVTAARVGPAGIQIDAQIQRVDRDSPLWERLEGAWQEIQLGLMRGLSIGFTGVERERMGAGWRYTKWRWHETSTVVVPANADATIGLVRAIAQGEAKIIRVRPEPPRKRGVVYLKPLSIRGRDGRAHSVRILPP